jgi:multiple sugar transport system permease protein
MSKKTSRLKRGEAVAFYLFISPWILGFIFFIGGPIISSFGLSLTNYSIINKPVFTWLANYKAMLKDPLFSKSLYNTFYYAVLFIPFGIVTSFGLAMFLNQKVRGLAFYRTIYYLPTVVPVVASAILWLWLLNPQWGLINMGLRAIGIKGPGWLTSEEWSKPSIVLMGVWGLGTWIVIYLAGLQGIPEQLYEAAQIDGANLWHRFIYITVPMMTPTIFFTLIVGIIGSFQVFTQAYIMTAGGPVNSTLFYALYMYRNAFNYLKMGYASAMAWVLFIIILLLTLIQFALANRWVYYEAKDR